jgi:hypothetical protein
MDGSVKQIVRDLSRTCTSAPQILHYILQMPSLVFKSVLLCLFIISLCFNYLKLSYQPYFVSVNQLFQVFSLDLMC